VASRTLRTLDWNNSTLLRGDVVSAVAALKSETGPDLQIIGSGNLIQTLQAASLIDEYNVWTFPVVLGRGKRLFEAGAKAVALRLVASQTSATGVVMSTYVPAGDCVPCCPAVHPDKISIRNVAKSDSVNYRLARLACRDSSCASPCLVPGCASALSA